MTTNTTTARPAVTLVPRPYVKKTATPSVAQMLPQHAVPATPVSSPSKATSSSAPNAPKKLVPMMPRKTKPVAFPSLEEPVVPLKEAQKITLSVLSKPSVVAAAEKEAVTMSYSDLIGSASSLIHQGGAATELALHMLAARAFGVGALDNNDDDDDDVDDKKAVAAKPEAVEQKAVEQTPVEQKAVEKAADVYARVFRDYGDKYYNVTFAELSKKYGAQYFPLQLVFLANSHPDSEFCIRFREDQGEDCSDKPELADFQKGNQFGFKDFDDAALWMLTESWTTYKDSDGKPVVRVTMDKLKSVAQMRAQLRSDQLRDDFISDEQVQLLIDMVQVDPSPYWTRPYEPEEAKVDAKVDDAKVEAKVDAKVEAKVEEDPFVKIQLALDSFTEAELYFILTFLGGSLANNNTADLIFEELVNRNPGDAKVKANHDQYLRAISEGNLENWRNCWSKPSSVGDQVRPMLSNFVTLLNYC